MLRQPTGYGRLQCVDVLRGVALAGMIIYHFSWDLSWFGYLVPEQVAGGGLWLLARMVAFGFLFLAGFSLFLAHRDGIRWKAFWRRFFIIVAAALLVSIVTYRLMPDNFIYFGILHEIALTSLIGLLFLRTPVSVNLLFAIAVSVFAGVYQGASSPWLWWLGLAADPRPSFDYVPFFPWFAAGLLGLTTARLLHKANRLQWLAGGIRTQPLDSWLQWAGRHSLFVYLVHQPVLLGLLYLCTLVFPPSPDATRAGMEGDCRLACEQSLGKTACEHFCRCSFDALEKRGLLDRYMRGKIRATDTAVTEIRSYCSTAGEALQSGD